MANVSRINGFRPVRYLSGAPWNGQITHYVIPASDATAVFVGDLVKFAATGSVDGIRAVTKAAVGDAVCGVVVGIIPNYANLNTPQYRLASTLTTVLVVDDPNVLFETQTSNGTITTSQVAKNANHADAGGSTVTGQSGQTLDVATIATTATLTLKLFGVLPRVDNSVAAAAKVLVKINNHQLGSSTGTAGV